MRTREESLNNFCLAIDGLISSNYLSSNSKLYEVMKTVNSSKLLTNMFSYFIEGFDYEKVFASSFITEGGVKRFTLPQKSSDAMALTFLILQGLSYQKIQLTDILQHFDVTGNFDLAYKGFIKEVLVPFKSYVYQTGIQMINSTQSKEEALASKKADEEEPLAHTPEQKPIEKPQNPTLENQVRILLRILDLERLAISAGKLSKDDTSELLYLIDLFETKIREKESEKIKLSYLAYLYASRPFKKIKSNIKDITEILIELKVI